MVKNLQFHVKKKESVFSVLLFTKSHFSVLFEKKWSFSVLFFIGKFRFLCVLLWKEENSGAWSNDDDDNDNDDVDDYCLIIHTF
jgi:hypothetical protein